MRTGNLTLLILSSTLLIGCAGIAPVPGGRDTVNVEFYESEDDLKTRVGTLEEGMSKQEVFDKLNRKDDDFIALGRDEIITALYGGHQFMPGYTSKNSTDNNYIKSLSGYKFTYKNVKRKHGVNSPISMKTNEGGFSYTTTLIFKNEKLYEKPILSGGVVNASSSKTLFDYLNLGSVIGRAGV